MNFTLTRAHTVSSALIRARLWDNWSHGLIHRGDTNIVDATFKHGGVRHRSLKDGLHGASEILPVHAPLEHEVAADQWLTDQLGKSYDWRAVCGWAGAGRTWHDEYAWFCFELIAAMIEQGSDYRFTNRNRVTGSDLIQAASVLRGEA